jgi:hypothetical protein
MLRNVALVRTDLSEDLSTSIIRVERIGELGSLAVTSNRRTLRRNTKYTKVIPSSLSLVTLMMEALGFSETSVLTRVTRQDDILHSHCRENLKSYIALTGWTL